MNRRSIGIEHEGWTYRRGSLTEAQYRSSTRLRIAWAGPADALDDPLLLK